MTEFRIENIIQNSDNAQVVIYNDDNRYDINFHITNTNNTSKCIIDIVNDGNIYSVKSINIGNEQINYQNKVEEIDRKINRIIISR